MADLVNIDFTIPVIAGREQPLQYQWDGNRIDLSYFYPGQHAEKIILARTQDCFATNYYVDKRGLWLEVQFAGQIQNSFGIFVENKSNVVGKISVVVEFDFVQVMNRRTSGVSEGFYGSLGVSCTSAPEIPSGILPAADDSEELRISATSAFNFDPEIGFERIRLNSPGGVANENQKFEFKRFPFLWDSYYIQDTNPASSADFPANDCSSPLVLEMFVTAGASQLEPAKILTNLSQGTWVANPPPGLTYPFEFTSTKFTNNLSDARFAGVTVNVTDPGPNPGPLRVRIRKLRVNSGAFVVPTSRPIQA